MDRAIEWLRNLGNYRLSKIWINTEDADMADSIARRLEAADAEHEAHLECMHALAVACEILAAHNLGVAFAVAGHERGIKDGYGLRSRDTADAYDAARKEHVDDR